MSRKKVADEDPPIDKEKSAARTALGRPGHDRGAMGIGVVRRQRRAERKRAGVLEALGALFLVLGVLGQEVQNLVRCDGVDIQILEMGAKPVQKQSIILDRIFSPN